MEPVVEDRQGTKSRSRLSLTESAALDDEVQQLRAALRDVFLDNGRRQEINVYHTVLHLLVFVRRWIDAGGGEEVLDEQSRLAVTRYMQDIFAALLFLIDVEAVDSCYPVDRLPAHEPANDGHDSQFYVSAWQRAHATLWFFFLTARLPTRQVIQALYPLLDTPLVTGAASTGVVSPQQNQIAPGLLRHQSCKRRLLGHVLNGLFLSRSDGVQGLLHVLVLSSDVPSDLVFEAAQHVVALVTAPVETMWWYNSAGEKGVVEQRTVSCERRFELLSAQLLPLFVLHAEEWAGGGDQPEQGGNEDRDGPADTTTTTALSRILRHNAQSTLPAETVENRLHLFLTLLCNTIVVLPSGDVNSVAYRRAYRDFFLLNKHFLTLAFGALTLRRKPPVAEGDVIAALLRLHTLLDGAILGASARSFLTVFDTVVTGFLHLTAVQAQLSSRQLKAATQLVWRGLHALDANTEEIANSLVRGALTTSRHAFVVTDRVAGSLCYCEGPLQPADVTLQAMVRAVFGASLSEADASLSRALQSVVLKTMAEHCRSALYGVSVFPARGATSSTETSPLSASLLAAVEMVCMNSPSDAIFGSDATLLSIFELLIAVAPLSALCFRWCTEMAASVASSPELLQPFLPCPPEPAAGCLAQKAPRLVRVLREFMEVLCQLEEAFTETERAGDSDAAVATAMMRGEASVPTSAAVGVAKAVVGAALEKLEDCQATTVPQQSVGLVHELTLQWGSLVAKIASALETQAQAPLSVALMALAASVEDAAYSVHAADRPTLEPSARNAIVVLLQALLQSGDVCACGHAIRALVWLGMYRFDATDSSFLGEALCTALLTSGSSTVVPPSSPLPSALLGRVMNASSEQLGRFKCRLLDVVLSLCDYDQEGRTLRNIDDSSLRTRGVSLFEVLKMHCSDAQLPVVQVASLHCMGYYVAAVYPRVSLASVCMLCKDVFRHTRVEMAKAACAAMLCQIAQTQREQGTLSAVADVDMAELLHVANAMAAYSFPYASTQEGKQLNGESAHQEAEHVLHGEVIREKGREVVRLLGATANKLFVQELDAN